MGVKSKKEGKRRRVDRFYLLAKEQGYRARSAFKLVQLDKKYNFLSSARAVIDLCAAPGGWMQVARKYCPVSSVVIGVDLFPIAPIRGCIALQHDITTPQCRAELKRHLREWKVDVVLHDGSPNMGSTWLHDAYTQSELTLHSLKLAAEFLTPGGTFVTKVFRSKDYNALYWVFTQLFEKCEAHKPPASRDVSAEIFVVCRGFLAPKKIDPRLLDPKHVFKELDSSAKPVKLFKAKPKANREGYDTNIGQVMHKRACITQFVDSTNPTQFLGSFHELSFDPALPLAVDDQGRVVGAADAGDGDDDVVPAAVLESGGNVAAVAAREAKRLAEKRASRRDAQARVQSGMTREAAISFYLAHPKTPSTIVDQLRDIRLLSKPELKRILMWHARMRKARADLVEAMAAARDGADASGSGSGSGGDDDEDEDSDDKLDRELGNELSRADQRRKRRIRKLRKQRSKVRMQAALGMHVSFEQDVGENLELFKKSEVDQIEDEDMKRALRHGRDNVLDRRTQLEAEQHEKDELARSIRFRLGGETVVEDSDSEHAGHMDDMLDQMYQDYKEAARLREATARAKRMRSMSKHKQLVLQQEQEGMIEDERRAHEQAQREVNSMRFPSLGSGKRRKKRRKRGDGDESDTVESDSSDGADSEEQRRLDRLAQVPATMRAALWYDQDLFDGIDDDASQTGAEQLPAGGEQSALDVANARRKALGLAGALDASSSSDDDESDDDSLADDFEAHIKRDSLRDIRAGKNEDADASSSSSDDAARKKERKPKTRREREREEKRNAILGKKDPDKDTGTFEVVPLSDSEHDSDSDKGGQDAQIEALAYARAMVNGRRKRAELEDNAFNRRAFADTETLPDWFVDDERQNNKVSLPVTKEDLVAVRAREIALNARPIKKVVEAKMRKQKRVKRRMERMKQQANAIADQTDIDDKQKMRMLTELYKGTTKTDKKPNKIYVVTNKSGQKRAAKNSRDQKGKVVQVDTRMKADRRGQKASRKRATKRKR